jgi:hypothetical protein
MKINSMNVKHNIYLYLRNTHTVKWHKVTLKHIINK